MLLWYILLTYPKEKWKMYPYEYARNSLFTVLFLKKHMWLMVWKLVK